MEELRFAPGSSFILPSAQAELALLAGAFDRLGRLDGASLALFGHADAAGPDEANKTLAGRRAQALYALLVRKVELWEQLINDPFEKDDWRLFAIEIMRRQLGASASIDRSALIAGYMDNLCRRNSGAPFRLAATDFLGRGADAGGKGDYQGCGAFNPIRVAAPGDEANAVNRRVSILLFRNPTSIAPNQWPCPRASESGEGCRKLFWPGARAQNAIACSFHEALARFTPRG